MIREGEGIGRCVVACWVLPANENPVSAVTVLQDVAVVVVNHAGFRSDWTRAIRRYFMREPNQKNHSD